MDMAKVLVVVEMDGYDDEGRYTPEVADFFLCDPADVDELRDPAGGHLNFHYPHDKGRDCARTDEVLDNYRRRAFAAESEMARLRVEA